MKSEEDIEDESDVNEYKMLNNDLDSLAPNGSTAIRRRPCAIDQSYRYLSLYILQFRNFDEIIIRVYRSN